MIPLGALQFGEHLIDDDGVQRKIERQLPTLPILAKTRAERVRVLSVDPTSQYLSGQLQLGTSLGYQSRKEGALPWIGADVGAFVDQRQKLGQIVVFPSRSRVTAMPTTTSGQSGTRNSI